MRRASAGTAAAKGRPHDPRLWWGAGVALALLLAAEWCWIYLHDPQSATALFSAVFTQVLIGREGGIPVGLMGGASPWLVLQFSVIEDIVESLLAIGLVYWATTRIRKTNAARPGWLAKARQGLQRRGEFFMRWRAAGIFAFTLVPFMVNGPLVAALGARMIGLGPRATFTAIAAGSCVAGASWTLLMVGLAPLVANWWPVIAIAVALTVLVARLGVARWTGAPSPATGVESYRPA